MISRLTGTILDTGPRLAILDVHDVGYRVFVTDDCLHKLKIGAIATFFTYLAVRENALDLYGFPTRKDEEFFELLISVSSIGPKTALNILSLVSSEALSNAIRSGSTAHLVKVSGIGRKTAEKIVLELKDKLGAILDGELAAGMSSDMDAIEALKALGYDGNESREALKKVDPAITETGAKVKAALKLIGK
jgi:Holliday junction DNA helicase RuvA